MYISIDVGIKNLAYIVYGETIIEWNVIELCNTNASKANIIDIGKKLFEALETIQYEFKEAIIENQIGPNAIRMKGPLMPSKRLSRLLGLGEKVMLPSSSVAGSDWFE